MDFGVGIFDEGSRSRDTIVSKNDSNGDVEPMHAFQCGPRSNLWTALGLKPALSSHESSRVNTSRMGCEIDLSQESGEAANQRDHHADE